MDLREAAIYIANQVEAGKDGSYSFNYEEPKTGFFVGGGTWTLVTRADRLEPYTVYDFLKAHSVILSWPGQFIGWWTDKGKVYLDVSEHFVDQDTARYTAETRSEMAIWDIAKGESIWIE